MKILWILLITTLIEAKVLEVKQLFNIQKVSVKKISFKEQKSFYAKTKIADNSIKAVALRYDGFINRLFIDKEYQFVKKDQRLFNIYSKEALAIHQEFLVSKQISRSAKSNAIRKLQLLELKGLTKFKKPIYDFNILSPFEGYVIEKNILEGSSIKKGKTLLKIADLSKLWVIAKVYQKDIGFIKKGMKAKISIDGFKPSTATVNFIYPKVDTKD
jgi:Cu(I)/Ag(I) efflux system membrane fusion protein